MSIYATFSISLRVHLWVAFSLFLSFPASPYRLLSPLIRPVSPYPFSLSISPCLSLSFPLPFAWSLSVLLNSPDPYIPRLFANFNFFTVLQFLSIYATVSIVLKVHLCLTLSLLLALLVSPYRLLSSSTRTLSLIFFSEFFSMDSTISIFSCPVLYTYLFCSFPVVLICPFFFIFFFVFNSTLAFSSLFSFLNFSHSLPCLFLSIILSSLSFVCLQNLWLIFSKFLI